MIIYICTSEILKTRFLVHNIYLYSCWQVANTKWIFCCPINGVKCAVFKITDVQIKFYVTKKISILGLKLYILSIKNEYSFSFINTSKII